jgi:hypothetical protein
LAAAVGEGRVEDERWKDEMINDEMMKRWNS